MSSSHVGMFYSVFVDWDYSGSGTPDFTTSGDEIGERDVAMISIKLGIDDITQQHVSSIGTCSLVLNNDDSTTGRKFSPLNSASPYYGKMVPNKPIKVTITEGTNTETLFRGYTRSFIPAGGWHGRDVGSTCAIECVDEMAKIQDERISLPLQTSILSSTLIRHIINSALKAAIAGMVMTMTAIPANNDTVIIGNGTTSTTATWKTTLTGSANEILRGATTDASAINLAAYINQAPGAGTTYSSTTTLPRIVTAQASGAAGYDNANADTNVYLRGNAGAGGTTTVTGADNIIGSVGNWTGVGLPADMWLGQSFTVTGGRVTQFTVEMGTNNGSPVGTITWQFHSDSGGSPGTVLQTGTFTPVASSNNTVAIGLNGIALQGSTTYWLTFHATTAQATDTFWEVNGNNANPYANGTLKYANAGSGWADFSTPTGSDAFFSVTTEAVTTKDKLAQSFQVGTNQALSTLSLYLRKIGLPTGTLTLRIESDSAGTPSGTLIDANASTTLAESSLTTSFANAAFTFSTPPALLTSTTYWFVLSTDRTASATNFVAWGADASSPGYTSGAMYSYASSTWSAESKDASFTVGSTSCTLAATLRGAIGNDYEVSTYGSWATMPNSTPITEAATDTTTLTASGSGGVIGNLGGSNIEPAQGFIPAVSGTVDQVTVKLGANTGSPTGTITLRIASDSGSDTPGSILFSTTYTPTASATNTIPIVSGPSLTASTKYWLWQETTDAQALNTYYTWQTSAASVYSGIRLMYTDNDASTWNDYNVDAECSIRVTYNSTIGYTANLSGGVDLPVDPAPVLETGRDTFQYAGDSWDQGSTNAMTALQETVESEYGSLLWIARSGAITFKNRSYSFTRANATATLTLSSQPNEVEGAVSAEEIFNRTEVTFTPLSTLSSGVIASSKSIVAAPGLTGLTERYSPLQQLRDQPGTVVVKLPFIDPGTGREMGALSVITPLVANTDYTANEASDGVSGIDYTTSARISLSVAVVGSNAEITITNTALGPLFFPLLQVRGVGLVKYNPSVAASEDTDSQDTYGKRTLTVRLPITSTDVTFPQSLSAYLLSRFKDPAFRVKAITFKEFNRVGVVNLFSIEIGDTLTLTDYQTNVSAQKYLITGINYEGIGPKTTGSITFNVYRLDDTTYWILQDATYGVLGTTTRPAL